MAEPGEWTWRTAQDKLPSAVDVAKYVLRLAAIDPDHNNPNGLSQRQIQKILYYVQGCSLGRRDCPIFREQIRAWREGPVVDEVYQFFKSDRHGLVALDDEDVDLPPLTKAFIASVWEDYKCYSERELIDKTHKETPWLVARRGFKDHESSDVLIRDADLREFFSQSSRHAIEPIALREIASRPEAAPPQSWFEEKDPYES